jgi:hypothetical protein
MLALTITFGVAAESHAIETNPKASFEKFCPYALDPNQPWIPELEELNGVWKDGLGEEVRFRFTKDIKMLAVPGALNFFAIADSQWQEDIVTFHVLQTNQAGQYIYNLWTLRRIWNDDRTGYVLGLDIPDFRYVRRYLPGEVQSGPEGKKLMENVCAAAAALK